MNPHYGRWPSDGPPGPDNIPDTARLTRTLDRRWVADFRAARLLATRPGWTPPPRDPRQWLAWANGEPTTGPRMFPVGLADILRRHEARRDRPGGLWNGDAREECRP